MRYICIFKNEKLIIFLCYIYFFFLYIIFPVLLTLGKCPTSQDGKKRISRHNRASYRTCPLIIVASMLRFSVTATEKNFRCGRPASDRQFSADNSATGVVVVVVVDDENETRRNDSWLALASSNLRMPSRAHLYKRDEWISASLLVHPDRFVILVFGKGDAAPNDAGRRSFCRGETKRSFLKWRKTDGRSF